MALKLVWTNPCPLTNAVAEVRRIMKAEYGSLYLVSYPDGYEEFELTTSRINPLKNQNLRKDLAQYEFSNKARLSYAPSHRGLLRSG